MQVRSSAGFLIVALTATSTAEPDTPHVIDTAAEQENRARLDAFEQQADRARRDRLLSQREAQRSSYLEELSRSEYDHERAVRAGHRSTGYKFLVTAGVFGAVAGVAGYLGGSVNGTIEGGQVATVDELQNLEDRGTILNYVSYGALGAAALTALIGLPYILFNLDRGEYEVKPMAGDVQGVSISGRF